MVKRILTALALAVVLASPAFAQIQVTGNPGILPSLQITAINTAAPASTDCDAAAETGKVFIDSTNDNMYFCSGASGWVTIAGGAVGFTWPVVVPDGGALQTALVADDEVLFQAYDTGLAQYVTVAKLIASATLPRIQFLNNTPEFLGVNPLCTGDGGCFLYSQDAARVTYAPVGLVGSTVELKTAGTAAFTIDANKIVSLTRGTAGSAQVKFLEDEDNGTNAVTLAGPASVADVTVTLPDAAGTLALVGDYAQLYFSDKTDNLAVGATYTLITTFDTSIASGITVDASKDFVTIAKTGIYMISTQLSFNGGNSKAYDCSIHKNDNTELSEVHFSRTMGAAAAIGSASAVGIVSLAATDTIRLKCEAAGTDTMVPRDGQLTIVQLR